MRTFLTASLLAAALFTPALADETTGEVLAFDRIDHILVLTDKTIWNLGPNLDVPEGLKAGDIVHIVYTSDGDNGVVGVNELHLK